MCAPIPFLLLQHYQGPIPRVILTLPHLGAKGALQKMTSKRGKGLYYYGELVFAFSDWQMRCRFFAHHNNGQICKDRVDKFIQDFNLSDPWDKNCMN
jgi:hypothetical protein